MTKNTNWTPETLPKAQSDTRTAAAVWISALKLDLDPLAKYSKKAGIKTSADEDLKRTVKKCFPDADIDMAQKLVKHAAPYENITDELLDEIIATTHTDGYEIIQWREIVLRVLAMDLLTALKSSSPQLIEDAVQRVTAITDEKLRGTTKNACQFISGQRTRIRKMVRMLTVAMLYHRKYRTEMTLESMQNDVMQLVKPCPDTDFVRDDFPFDDFLAANKEINARGRFAFCEAVNAVNEIQSKLAEIDEIIQNSSKRWRVSRMDLNDLNILRLAAYELCFERISTPRILINEAVELAKLFGAEQSKNFVNGILQQLCNDRNIEVV